jgi:hypothetical protein
LHPVNRATQIELAKVTVKSHNRCSKQTLHENAARISSNRPDCSTGRNYSDAVLA